MQKKIKFSILIFIVLTHFAFAQNKSDNTSVPDQLKSKLNGAWFNVGPKGNKLPAFEIIGDTFFRIEPIEKYRMKITADSILTMYEILTAQEHKTIKPKVTLSKKIYNLTADSLVLLGWRDGRKKYERYYKGN